MRRTLTLTILILSALFLLAGGAAAADKPTQDLYLAKCKACHGTDGMATPAGKKLGARDFNAPEVTKMSDAELLEVTTKGKEKMPAYGPKLKADEIKSLVAYVRELAKAKK
jgi:mono/diheme cytochrome c family protein